MPTQPKAHRQDTTGSTRNHSRSTTRPAKQVAIDVLRKAGEPLHAKRDRQACARVRPSRRSQGQDTPRRRSARCSRLAPAGRPLRACRQGHLHRQRRGEQNRDEDATADACWCEADAGSREGTGGEGDEPDANKARGGEAVKLAFVTLATIGCARRPGKTPTDAVTRLLPRRPPPTPP